MQRTTEYDLINFKVGITLDCIVLLHNNPDIRIEVANSIAEGCPLDDLERDIESAILNSFDSEDEDVAQEFADNIIANLSEIDTDMLMSYIEVYGDDAEFDYGESEGYDDRSMCGFQIPCEFDLTRFAMDVTAK